MKREVTYRRPRGDSPLVGAEKKVVGFDVWLQRASLIAQAGLFVITIGTLYFTVIPLYQKALLDEEIAKKQVLLEHTQADLAAAYAQVRSFTIGHFVFDASVECSGVMRPPDNERESFRAILDIDPATCLNKEFARVPLGALRPEDQTRVRAKVAEIVAELVPDRAAAIKKYGEAETTARTHPPVVRIKSPTYDALAALVVGPLPESVTKENQWRMAAEQERTDAAMGYVGKLSSRIDELKMIRWTDSKPNNG